MSSIIIDGVSLALESPSSVDAFAARVGELIAVGQAIYPVGGGTGLDYGNPPSSDGVALSLAHLNHVIDYPIRDLTITVEAGITVAEVQRLLAQQNQRLPVDVPNADRATFGGAASVGAFGPRRLSSGTFRDHVIGITVVNDQGDLCSSGGRVVKNVAGYDLAKLYAGALGTLGIVVAVTLRLQPRPPASAWIIGPVAPSHLTATLDRIHSSATRPAAVDLLNANAARAMDASLTTDEFLLAVLFEDNAEAVEWQIGQLTSELQLPFNRVADIAAFEHKLIDSPAVAECGFSILATTRPSAVAEMLTAVNAGDSRLHAHAMSGIVRVGATKLQLSDAQPLQHRVLDLAKRGDGNAVVRRCDFAWKSQIPVWGHQSPSQLMMKKVKEQFDPRNLLNPGRFSQP